MNVASATIKKTQPGTCPHGLPYGACPICSGGGAGGGSKKTARPAGEMSWDQCYAVWQQMLKAKDAAQQKKHDQLQAQLNPQATFAARIENLSSKFNVVIDKLSSLADKAASLPRIISLPLTLALKIAIPILNVIKDVVIVAQKVINFVQQKFADISDKLTAIFGEMKNAVEKKISDNFKNVKKKFKSFFGLHSSSQLEDEEQKVEEEKRTFELKTVLDNLKEKFTQKKELKEQEYAA